MKGSPPQSPRRGEEPSQMPQREEPSQMPQREEEGQMPQLLSRKGEEHDKGLGVQMADPCLYGLLKQFVKENRKNETMAEMVFWKFLRGDQLGVHFRRQHIIGDYIADFVCLPLRLIIELDGGYHQLPTQQIKAPLNPPEGGRNRARCLSSPKGGGKGLTASELGDIIKWYYKQSKK